MNTVLFQDVISDGRIDSYLLASKKASAAKRIHFDFHPTTSITPAGYALLASLIDAALEKKCLPEFSIPKPLARQFPFLNQLKEIAGLGRFPDPESYRFESEELLLSASTGLDLDFLEKLENKFSLDEDLFFDCRMILQELMQNALSHSGAERFFIYPGTLEKKLHF